MSCCQRKKSSGYYIFTRFSILFRQIYFILNIRSISRHVLWHRYHIHIIHGLFVSVKPRSENLTGRQFNFYFLLATPFLPPWVQEPCPSGSIVALLRCHLLPRRSQLSRCFAVACIALFRPLPQLRFFRHRRRSASEPVSPASSTPPISLHLAQLSHCSLPFALLVSPASSASLHPPQAALRLRSHRQGRCYGAFAGSTKRQCRLQPHRLLFLSAFQDPFHQKPGGGAPYLLLLHLYGGQLRCGA